MAVYNKGMDIEQVDAAVGKLDGHRGELAKIESAVDGAVNKVKGDWGGHDADQFLSDWNKAKPSTQAAIDALKRMADKCRINAAAQKSASA